MSASKTFARLLAAGVLAGGAGLAWANYETHQFTLRRFSLPVLPQGTPDLKILHISDLHLTPGQADKIAWVRSLAELEPDLVINTGDNMAHRDVLPALKLALEPLTFFPGAFVFGSNDYYSPVNKNPARYLLPDSRVASSPSAANSAHETSSPRDTDLPWRELRDHLTGHGWQDLTNTRAIQVLGDLTLEFAGVDDPHLDRDRYPAPLASAEQDTPGLRIGVTHAPYTRVLDQMHADGCEVIIAGHTHGGQLCIPGYGALVTNCDLDRKRAKGLHGWPGARPDQGGTDSSWLHVCAGLGTSPFAPFRFACRPEASLLTLTAR